MRVAYVCADPGVPVFGTKGASVHVQEVLRALQRRGDTVDLLTPRPGGPPPPGLDGVRVHVLPPPGRGPVAERERRAQAADADLRAALTAAPVPALVYERYSLWSAAGTAFARAAGIPCVLEVNAPLVEEQARHRGLVDRVGAEDVARRAFAAATVVVAVSDEVAAWVRTTAPGARVHVVPNGVDPARFGARRPRGTHDDGTLTVGFVGSLKPWHGVDRLVRAVARLAATGPGWRLLVVGDGPERARLTAAVDAAGLADAVTFTGAVAPEDVATHLEGVDIAVAPYPADPRTDPLGCYFSPLKVFEYLAAGLPVVASRVGQIPHVLADGRTGVLVPPGDVRALADALAALRRDPVRRASLGAAGRAHVVAHHTWDAAVARILTLATSDGRREVA